MSEKYTVTYDDGEVFDWRFKCFVERLQYDYQSKIGVLIMGELSCTDMSGCIGLFKCIDPNVKEIHTRSDSGSIRDTIYKKKDGKWHSIRTKETSGYTTDVVMSRTCEREFPAKFIPPHTGEIYD